MTQIICLANSWKHGERCIAGIDIHSKKWVRPIYTDSSDTLNGSIPSNIRLVDGIEPRLLDIISIPLAKKGDDFGFQSENRNILPGTWIKMGEVAPNQLIGLCDQNPCILHNFDRYVTLPFLQSLPVQERKTLQLVYTEKLSISTTNKKWKASLKTNYNAILTDATITDPEFVSKLEWGYIPQNPCLVTVSLSMPFVPSENWKKDPPYWKLIAGIMELV